MLPVKGSNRLVRSVVHAFGSDDLRAEVLAGVADGEVTCCLGYTEPDCGSDAAAVTTRATRDGDEWVVTGQKMFSTGAHLCQYVMITARTDPDAPKHRGITMFLVPTNTPGVETQGISTLGGERTNFVYFDGARIADRYRLGPVDQGWRVASGALAAEHGIDDGTVPETAVGTDALLEALRPMNGGWQNELAAVHDAALAWAMTPPVAGAPPPIDDPQVRRRLAQVALDAELVAVTPNPYARVIASDLLVRDAADLLDMTGAAGMLEWGEAGSPAGGYLEWAHRFAQGTSIYGGTTDIQRNLIAEQFLGLPRHAGPVRG
jgi:alkylation response protein AidB-like acyl-CoA dehydrogenase